MSRTKDQFRELTRVEIGRQTALLNQRREEITRELQQICTASMRSGKFGGAPPVDVAEEERVRTIARTYLNGSAPAWLSEPLGDPRREQTLYRERRGVDLALKVLTDARIETETAEALEYAAAHRSKWCELVHELLTAAIQIRQLSARLREMAHRATGAPLPCAAHFGSFVEVRLAGAPLREVLPDAVSAGLISSNEAAICAD